MKFFSSGFLLPRILSLKLKGFWEVKITVCARRIGTAFAGAVLFWITLVIHGNLSLKLKGFWEVKITVCARRIGTAFAGAVLFWITPVIIGYMIQKNSGHLFIAIPKRVPVPFPANLL